MFKLVENRNEKGEQLSIVFCQTVSELMNDDEKLVFIDSDLASPSGSSLIEKAHPDRFINVGIAEANMVGVASGLSIEGFKPFIHSFAPFASRRVFDQIYLSELMLKLQSMSMVLIQALLSVQMVEHIPALKMLHCIEQFQML